MERTLRGPGGFFVLEQGSFVWDMSEGWIKLHRKFEDWEWFNNSEMVHLFIYLLLNANHEDGKWRGIEIKRGQIITGLLKLNEKTKISIQKIRTCLSKLEKTGEINKQTTNKYSIITILNYDSYQGEQQTINKQVNKQSTNNQQTTNNKQECKNEKNEKNKRIFIAPTVEEVENYFNENGYCIEAGRKAFNYYNVADWHDSKGMKIRNWKQKMQAVWFKDENKKQSLKVAM